MEQQHHQHKQKGVLHMEQYFNNIIDSVLGAPHMIYVSFIMAGIFIIGGIVLYVNRKKLKGYRWPGVTCTLLGCASMATTAIQYIR